MESPRISQGARRPSAPRRKASALGKTYVAKTYQPQYALGIVCRGEADQRRLFVRVRKLVGDRDVKVLVL